MITTLTLNTSIDKAYHMKGGITNGKVMRVDTCNNSAGGKGLNVARTIKLCGEEVLATGFAGGFNGAYLKSLLDMDEIPHCFYTISGETRSCINILDETYGSTEYLEPGCEVTEEETEEFLQDTFLKAVADSSVVTISGSIPKGVRQDIYPLMIKMLKEQGKKVILDTSGELLKNGIKSCPTMIKPNKDEIEMLFQIQVKEVSDIIYYAKKLHQEGIDYVAVSLGKDGALLACEEGVYLATPPKLKSVNTVGCGDSMVGAFAVALERSLSPEESLKFAAAVSAANAMSADTGRFDKSICEEIKEQIKIARLE